MENSSAAIVAVSALGVKFPAKYYIGDDKQICRQPVASPAHQFAPEPERLDQYAPSEKPWDVHRAQADAVTEIFRCGGEEFKRLAQRVSQCSQILDYAWVGDGSTGDTGELRFKLRNAQFCRVRTCPICQWRRSLMWFGRFTKALDRVMKEAEPNPDPSGPHPYTPDSVSFLFLTLTVENCEVTDLRKTLNSMQEGWRRFMMRKEFAGIKGWVRTTEVTHGTGGTAHPHFHVLLMVRNSWFKKSYVSQASWCNAWKAAAALDYVPIVHVEKVKGEIDGEILRAAAETLKYAVKPSDAISHPQWFLELNRQLRKLRFIAAGGVFKKAFRPDETAQGLLLMEDSGERSIQVEHGRVAFNWEKPVQHYRRMRD